MKIILILPIFLALSSCSTVEFKPRLEDKNDEAYYKAKNETVNMSEYDKQRYYDQNNLKNPSLSMPKKSK